MLDVRQEGAGFRAVEDAVVEGEAQVHDGTDGDGVVYDHRALDDGFCVEYGRLLWEDDGLADDGPDSTGVVNGEGAALYVLDSELAAPGSAGEVVQGPGELGDRLRVGVVDHRHEQPPLWWR